eukprot:5720230-Amphidinium_carterae.1
MHNIRKRFKFGHWRSLKGHPAAYWRHGECFSGFLGGAATGVTVAPASGVTVAPASNAPGQPAIRRIWPIFRHSIREPD